MATGITKKHSRKCSRTGRCDCPYEAWVWSKRDEKKIRKTFAREREAIRWRSEAMTALDTGKLRAPKPTTIEQAWQTWHEGARAGAIRNRSGDAYKPSSLRAYERAMRLRVLPEFGSTRVADVRRPDLQAFVNRLLSDGHDPSTIQTTLLPLRAIYAHAISLGELAVNPTSGLKMPAVRGRRERFASPEEAAQLIAAVPAEDRAVWATATYGGLRRGELMALRLEDVDLATGLIHVRRGWDDQEGEIELKSSAGKRKVPIAAILRSHLLEHKLATGRHTGLVFGPNGSDPFNPRTLTDHADKAWEDAAFERITLHECRHTFASLMIAARVNAKALSTFMGHANISITLDRYGHLMPGSEDEAAGLLDTYLKAQQERAEEQARAATGAQTGAHESLEPASPLVHAEEPR
jgi:integrase